MTKLTPLLLSVFGMPLVAMAGQYGDFTYSTNETAAAITGYTGAGGAVVIPDTIDNLPVTEISGSAFAYCNTLTDLTVPGGVATIGGHAFEYCQYLRTVVFSNGLTTIGPSAFFDCVRLTSVALPDSLTSIGDHAFVYGNFRSLVIPNSVTYLGDYAFARCESLTNVTLSSGLTSIGNGIFSRCYYLTGATIPDGVTSIGDQAFGSCISIASVTIPSNVTSIAYHAFGACSSLNRVYFCGNAPSVVTEVFYANSPTVYYLPGTTNWGDTFSGRPAVLWNPVINTPSVDTNAFRFNITGTTNIPIVVQACTNLSTGVWTSLQAATLAGGSFYFVDSSWTNHSTRFYRIGAP